MQTRRMLAAVATAAGVLMMAQPVLAGAHTWDVVEVFSNADGTIQFIEIREMQGTPGEVNLAGHNITSTSLGNSFTIPTNVAPPSTGKSLLFATAAAAALPGMPTPNHILPVAPFFNPAGDTVSYTPYDAFTFGAVPTDCIMSMNDNGVIAVNSPKNYAGQTGSVNGCPKEEPCTADLDGNATVNVSDLLALIGSWGACGDPENCPADIAPEGGDDTVNVTDLLGLIGQWGACP